MRFSDGVGVPVPNSWIFMLFLHLYAAERSDEAPHDPFALSNRAPVLYCAERNEPSKERT
jgi:hypothetical protein